MELVQRYREWRSTKLTRLVNSYLETRLHKKKFSTLTEEDKVLYEVYTLSPDMQMLLNLLTEKEGIWSAILILSLFDKSFKNEFKVKLNFSKNPNLLLKKLFRAMIFLRMVLVHTK